MKHDVYYEIVEWHREQAKYCLKVAEDEPRIDPKTREKARQAAIHHNASAVAIERKFMKWNQTDD